MTKFDALRSRSREARKRWSRMPGEIVYDPFSGIGTVPYRAVLKKRVGWGCELSESYYYDSMFYLQAAEVEAGTPTLFELIA